MKSKIIDILEKHFNEPEKIDDWTTIYMQEKFIKIAVEIESLYEAKLKEELIKFVNTKINRGKFASDQGYFSEWDIDEYLKQRKDDTNS